MSNGNIDKLLAELFFGKSIPVPEHALHEESSHGFSPYNQRNHGNKAVVDNCGKAAKDKADDRPKQKLSEQDAPKTSEGTEINCQVTVQHGEVKENEKPEDEQVIGNETNSDQKVLKKPDKILPCPRCDSMDTKFCYFNNYNVNQPRHFCRNCQRYWTAGGTMRNVPVGSGRRKNKQATSHYHQVVLTPATVPAAQNEMLKPASQWHLSSVRVPISSRPIEGLGDVQKFATDASLCQSMATVLNLKDHKGKLESTSGLAEDNGEASYSCGSSSYSTALQETQLLTKEMKQFGLTDTSHGSPPAHPLQLYSARPWPYPWNPKAVASEAGNSNPVYMACPPMMLSGFCSPNITVPVVPVANWNCSPRLPFFPSSSCASPSSSTTSSGCSCDSTPILGKHSRETNLQGEEKTEQSLWVPKTLRINVPEDAAKSPIWNTLGVSPNKSITKTSMLKALQSRSDFTSHKSDTDKVLQANPAALSRSRSFQEGT